METYLHELQAKIQETHWWFRGRRRLIETFLEPLGHTESTLEVGCGTGPNAGVLEAGTSRLVGLDRDAVALRHACHTCRVQADAGALPFRDGAFHRVVALDVMEHVRDHVALARELGRVTRPGGHILVFVPALPILWGVQDELSHHERRYTRRQLVETLRAGGLCVDRTSYFNTLLFPPILSVRLLCRLWRPSKRSENEWTPRWLNAPLAALFSSESRWLRRHDLPIGVSLMALASPPRQGP